MVLVIYTGLKVVGSVLVGIVVLVGVIMVVEI